MGRTAATFLATGPSPSNDQARDWAREELSHSRYRADDSNLVEKSVDWLIRRIAEAFSISRIVPTVIVIVLTILVVGFLVYAIRRMRRTRTAPEGAPDSVLGDDPVSATELRQRAEQCFAQGDYDRCVREAMRALTRRAAQAQLLTDAPSLTAREVADALRTPFPVYVSRLAAAATLFDSVMYGFRHADADAARAILDLDTELSTARPQSSRTGGQDRGFAIPR